MKVQLGALAPAWSIFPRAFILSPQQRGQRSYAISEAERRVALRVRSSTPNLEKGVANRMLSNNKTGQARKLDAVLP
jgi:hypothetical protein